MTELKIDCPNCGIPIEIEKIVEKEVLSRNRKTIEEETRKATAGLEAKIKEQFAVEMGFLKESVAEKDKKLMESQKSELELLKMKKDLEVAQREVELKVEKMVQIQLGTVRAKVTAESAQAIKVAQEETKTSVDALRRQQEIELNLRKENAGLLERMEAKELEIARKVQEERGRIRSEAIKQTEEAHRFQLNDKEKTISEMKKVIEELSAKAIEGSQQKKGEVAELELEKKLKEQFARDSIEPVAKGVQGADIRMRVVNNQGQESGSILIESKRTKAWNNAWVDKLKQDKQDAKAYLAVLVTATMPAGKEKFFYHEGIWITDFNTYLELLSVLRVQLIELSRLARVKDNKAGKMGEVYKYICGNEFTQKVNAVLENAQRMRDDLTSEKNAIIKIWSRREKQIDLITGTTSAMVGEIEALIGTAMAPVTLREDMEKQTPKTA